MLLLLLSLSLAPALDPADVPPELAPWMPGVAATNPDHARVPVVDAGDIAVTRK